MVRQRVRIRFSKSGRLRYIGHQDLLRTLERLFRRARLPLAMSQGFHPKAKISSPSALALGLESEDEVLDIEMDESAPQVDPVALLSTLNRCSLDGLVFREVGMLGPQQPKARLHASRFALRIPEAEAVGLTDRVAAFLAAATVVVLKSNGKPVDVRPAVLALEFEQQAGTLEAEILANKQAHAGPEVGIRELIAALGLADRLFRSVFPTRTRSILAENG